MIDYEKKYKEALGWMRDVYPTLTGAAKEDAEHFFPEVLDSEADGIIRDIIRYIEEGCHQVYDTRWIDWLKGHIHCEYDKKMSQQIVVGKYFCKREDLSERDKEEINWIRNHHCWNPSEYQIESLEILLDKLNNLQNRNEVSLIKCFHWSENYKALRELVDGLKRMTK